MAELSKRAQRIVGAGKALAGDRWQTALEKASGVKQQLLAMIASGEREPSDRAYKDVADGLLKEAGRLRRTASAIEAMAKRMLRDLKEEK